MARNTRERIAGQTTLEYLFLAVGVIIFIVLVYVLLQGNIISKQSGAVQAGVSDFLLGSEYYLFFDNFDSDTANQWTPLQETWKVINKEYVQDDTSDEQKITYAGSSGWVNYYADTKVQFDSLLTLGILGGISARVNKNSGARYSCIFELTSTTPAEGVLKLMRYYDWEATEPDELNVSSTFGADNSVHVLGIRANGNDLGCYWDNVEKIAYTDSTPFKYGMLSLEQRLASTHFDTVRAKYQEGPTPSGATPVPPSPTATPEGGGDSPSPSPTPAGTHFECSGFSCVEVEGPGPGLVPCETDLDCESVPLELFCADGTSKNTCNATKPFYCGSRYIIIANCTGCGCPAERPFCDLITDNCTEMPSLFFANIVNYSINFTSAIVNWSTSMLANGTVYYGPGFASTATHANYLEDHSVSLSGLTPNTEYQYKVGGCNATLCNETEEFAFKTLPVIYISGVQNYSVTEVSAVVNWTTNIAANGTVKYGLDQYTMSSTKTHSNLLSNHSLNLTGLTAGTNYTYQIISCASGVCNTTGIFNFRTLPPFCSDTDTGRDPLTAGSVTDQNRKYTDWCDSEFLPATGHEYFCIGPTKYEMDFACQDCNGLACSGAYCGDSQSYVYSNTGTFNDGACLPCGVGDDSETYKNYYCLGTTVKSRFDQCNCQAA